MPFTKTLLFISIYALSACATIYTSPKVRGNSDQVYVVEMSPNSIAFANESSYRPKQLPAIFNQGASAVSTRGINSKKQSYKTPNVSLPPRAKTGPYRLGVSDVILLATPTPQSPEALTGLIAAQNKRQGYTIQDDGSIAVPDIGRIDLAGRTIKEAETEVFQALVKNQIDPKFSLEVAEFKSKSVSIGGAVNGPTVAPITLKPLTLQDALQNAGGIKTETPEFTNISIFRNNKKYQIPLQELSKQPNLRKLILQAGDNVLVENDFQRQVALIGAKSQALEEIKTRAEIRRGQVQDARTVFLTKLELGAVKRDYAYITGEVTRQGRYELPFNNTATLADILYAEAQGIPNREGNLAQIYLLRAAGAGTAQRITAYHLNARNAVNLVLAAQMEVRPNDVVFVSERHVTAWNRVLSQILPTLSLVERVGNN